MRGTSRTESVGACVVAAPPLLAALIVPGAVADYRKRFPAIEVSVIDAQTNIIVDKVRSGEADCGIGTFAEAEEGIRTRSPLRGRAHGVVSGAIAMCEVEPAGLGRICPPASSSP